MPSGTCGFFVPGHVPIHPDIGVREYHPAFYQPLCECIESRAGGVFR